MDWQSVLIIVLVLLGLFWLLFRLRGNTRNPSKIQITMGLITNIDEVLKNINQRKRNSRKVNKFNLSGWKFYLAHLDFLDEDTVTALNDSFAILTEYNSKIDAAASNPGTPLPEFSFDTVWDLLVKGRMGLSTWTRDNITRETIRTRFIWR